MVRPVLYEVKWMTENKEHTWRFASIKVWLSQITEKNMLKGATIVVLTGLLAAVIAYSNAARIEAPIAGVSGTFKTISAAATLTLTLLGWIFSSLTYHAGASVLGGKGSLKRVFALSGYVSMPLLLQEILRFIYYVIFSQSPSASTSVNILTLLVDHFTFFKVACLVLTGVAVMLNYGVSGRKAAFVTLLPTLIIIAFTLLLSQYFGGAIFASGNRGGAYYRG
ncbi:hypothetical protein A3K78_03345 [Candidatus Bathyarchaeota archaeon RBG_13_52_12]|nr:MAG: hypothetical protein A3K78_03345 [Candidatus Bathyarchaeota archaeon RBG_13_52_12]